MYNKLKVGDLIRGIKNSSIIGDSGDIGQVTRIYNDGMIDFKVIKCRKSPSLFGQSYTRKYGPAYMLIDTEYSSISDTPKEIEVEVNHTKNEIIESEKKTMPERYIINKNACILFYPNKEKIVVRRMMGYSYIDKQTKNKIKVKADKSDPRLAFLIAFFQKNSGMTKNKANKFLDNLIEEKIKGEE